MPQLVHLLLEYPFHLRMTVDAYEFQITVLK